MRKAKIGDYKVLYKEHNSATGLNAHASEEDHGIGQVLCRLYRLPIAFYDDHTWNRLLPAGVEERITKQHVFAWLSPHDIWELKSDADYYTDGPTAAQMRESSGARYDLQAAAMLRALETA